jgi:hypothetical protein
LLFIYHALCLFIMFIFHGWGTSWPLGTSWLVAWVRIDLLGTRWPLGTSCHQILWGSQLVPKFLGTSWLLHFGYDLTYWVRVDLGTSWSGYELTINPQNRYKMFQRKTKTVSKNTMSMFGWRFRRKTAYRPTDFPYNHNEVIFFLLPKLQIALYRYYWV